MLATLEVRKTKLLNQIKKLRSQVDNLESSENRDLAWYRYQNNVINPSSDRLEENITKQVLLEDYVLAMDHSILMQ